MNTPIILTGEIGLVVLLIAAPLILVGRQALREGWVKGSGHFSIVPPGRRWEDGRKVTAVGAGEDPAATAALAAVEPGRKRRGA